jgi:hypothetical protein
LVPLPRRVVNPDDVEAGPMTPQHSVRALTEGPIADIFSRYAAGIPESPSPQGGGLAANMFTPDYPLSGVSNPVAGAGQTPQSNRRRRRRRKQASPQTKMQQG